jgi:hypothetical protein
MRAVDVSGADIDAPWLFESDSFFRVNGVDVIPLVDAELNRRFPGRAERNAADPEGLRAVWAALQRSRAATLEVRASRVAMVRDFLAATPDVLAEARKSPWEPEGQETVLSSLHTILGEERDHLRYAVRDLDTIEAKNEA